MKKHLAAALAVCVTTLAAPLAVAVPATAAATAYYVDCSAAANGDGSQAAPFNNLIAVNDLMLSAGDQVLFKRGTRCVGEFKPQGSGAAGSPIIADDYGTGPEAAIDGNGTSDAILLDNVQYWEIRNLEVTNDSAAASNRRGVRIMLSDFGTGHYYRLTNLTIHNVKGDNSKDLGGSAGISLEARGTSVPTAFDDVVLSGNDIYTVDRSGIFTTSQWDCRAAINCSSGPAWTPFTHVIVENNTVHDIGGDGIVLVNTDHALAQYNTLYDINMRSNANNAGIWAFNSDYTTFQHNEVYRVRRPTGTSDGEAFDIDDAQTGTVYQYNYSHDNAGGMMLFCGCGDHTMTGGIARYNISQNDGSRIIYAAGAKNSLFYNNTVYLPQGSTTSIVQEGEADTQLTIANNIFDNQGSGGYDYLSDGGKSLTWSNNIFFGRHPGNQPSDSTELTSDPQFSAASSGGTGLGSAAGYQLASGSPALRAGMSIPANGGIDFYGNPVPATCPPDIGADQATPAGSDCTDLAPGQKLTADETVISGDAHYELVMQNDGNLVEYAGSRPLWATGTGGHPGAYAVMQTDGNLVVYTAGNSALWASHTNGHAGAYLHLQDDADLVVKNSSGNGLWANNAVDSMLRGQTLAPGWFIRSPSGQYKLIMQNDGNLVLYNGSSPAWASGTVPDNGAHVSMQSSDGNLVVYATNGLPLWASRTTGHPGAYLQVLNNGTIVITDASGNILWTK